MSRKLLLGAILIIALGLSFGLTFDFQAFEFRRLGHEEIKGLKTISLVGGILLGLVLTMGSGGSPPRPS